MATQQIKRSGLVHAVAFSPHPRSCNLLAVGERSEVVIFVAAANPPLQELQHIHHGTRVTAIGWSPQSSSMADAHQRIVFCTGGEDYKIKIFDSDLVSGSSVVELAGHTDFINAVAFDNGEGNRIASTGDDSTVRIWAWAPGTGEAAETGVWSQQACISLSSPGTAVAWHPRPMQHEFSAEDEAINSLQYMVAERGGTIRFMHAGQTEPLASLYTNKTPLLDADWSPYNPAMVGAVAGGHWVFWNTESSVELYSKKLQDVELPARFRWSAVSGDKFAIAGVKELQIHYFNPQTFQTAVGKTIPDCHCPSLSWSSAEPTCCFAAGTSLLFETLD